MPATLLSIQWGGFLRHTRDTFLRGAGAGHARGRTTMLRSLSQAVTFLAGMARSSHGWRKPRTAGRAGRTMATVPRLPARCSNLRRGTCRPSARRPAPAPRLPGAPPGPPRPLPGEPQPPLRVPRPPAAHRMPPARVPQPLPRPPQPPAGRPETSGRGARSTPRHGNPHATRTLRRLGRSRQCPGAGEPGTQVLIYPCAPARPRRAASRALW